MPKPIPKRERFLTGITGLDTVLGGGFLKSSIYLIMGVPGSGKTVLANQICFEHAHHGGKAMYITLLAEPNSRMLQYLEGFSYFDRRCIPDQIVYLSVFTTLEKDGIDGLILLIQQEILRVKPTLLVIDGFAVAGEVSESTVAFKKFVHQLNVFTATTNCSAILISSIADSYNRPEHTMVDGLIVTHLTSEGKRTFREMEVRKLRGSRHLQGRHYLTISELGITVFPRLESLPVDKLDPLPILHKRSSGIPSLDRLIDGGLLSHSVTMVAGGAGTGKTLIGLHFLQQGVLTQEPSLYFGFGEWPGRLLEKARQFGMDLAGGKTHGRLHLLWLSPTELCLDEVADQLLHRVRSDSITRIFIDGIDALLRCDTAERSRSFIIALTYHLRLHGVTVLMSEDTSSLPDRPMGVVSGPSTTDNILVVEQNAIDGTLHRRITVIKVRDGASYPQSHAFTITQRGIVVGRPITVAATTTAAPPAPRRMKAQAITSKRKR